MREISNTTLAVLVFAALVVVVWSTLVRFDGGTLTGYASSDTGNVTLTIGSSLHIQVDPGNSTINFGTCTPRAGVSYICATNDTTVCDGTPGGNCTGDTTTPQFLRVENIGNVNASVNVSASCGASTLIGGTGAALDFMTTGCGGTGVATWTTLPAGAPNAVVACTRIVPTTGAFNLYARATIPSDALQTCTTSVLTFSAVQVS